MGFLTSRNFIFSVITLIVCAFFLTLYAYNKKQDFDDANDYVSRTHNVIHETQDISNQILTLVSLQRGYLYTDNENFKKQYQSRQDEIKRSFQSLEDKSLNPEYKQDIMRLEGFFNTLVTLLNNTIETSDITLADTRDVEAVRQEIRETSNNLLDRKYALMSNKIEEIRAIQERLIIGSLLGLILTGLILTGLNYYLYRLRRQNAVIGKDLFDSRERLQYAMVASGEGIYDWNVETGYVFFSDFFIQMLGSELGDFVPSVESFKERLHPDDIKRVMEYVDSFVNDKLSEYSIEFRLKHEEGHYIWVNSRAVAVRNNDRKAVRIIGTHRNITDLKMRAEKLKQHADQAEKDSAAKSEFLAHMSHEIRTPLTTITGISEILQKYKNDKDERYAELISTLSTSSKTLKELVNDILDFSKIEKGEVELEYKPFMLDNLIGEVISIMAVPAAEKGLDFKFSYDDVKYYEYHGDENRMKQVLINLIGNAVKFTDSGSVRIAANIESKSGMDYLSFVVQDTGIGIDNSMLDTIFNDFKQADSSISRRYGGTGLGLPISKKLATLMGGGLIVESQKGIGSTFKLYLPIQDSGLKLISSDDLQLREKMNDKLVSAIHDQQCALIVEDYEGNIVILSYLMEEIGLDYDVARTGVEALEKWRSKYYNLVLMDVQMPEMDGITATSKIREIEADNLLEATPIIGMTAHALIQDKDKCLESGMTDYISKPIDNMILKEKILKYIKNFYQDEQTSKNSKKVKAK
jgi:PAS domain S-box-containing protein